MKKPWFKIISRIILLLPFMASAFGTYLLMKYPYLDTKLNAVIILSIFLLSSIVCLVSLRYIRKHRKKRAFIMLMVTLLLSAGIGYLDYIYIRLDNSVNEITDTTEYEYSYLYVLDSFDGDSIEDLNHKTIGTKATTDELGYIIPIASFDEANIKYDTKVYSNGTTAASDLLNGYVDAIVINNTDLNKIDELYSEFALSTRCIAEFKRELTDENEADSVSVTTEPFTVLINGVDTRYYDINAGSRADVIMLATFNPQTMKLSLISIPRDTYIPVKCEGGVRDKITHSGNYGVNCTIESLEDYFDIEINYYVKLNFQAVVGLVDTVGGIDVTVPRSFCEQDSNDTPDAICLDAGYQHLNGEQALALSRHRKTLPNGDIGRGVNQQIVINGLIDKFASGTIVTSVDKLLTILGDNVSTNMPKKDMMQLFAMLTSLGSESLYSNTSSLEVTSTTLQGEGAMIYAEWAGFDLYYYVPYKEAAEQVKVEIDKVKGTATYDFPSNFTYDANNPYDPYDTSAVNMLTGYTLDLD